jgi:uncharacterized protein (DUF433 family)/DNA-binding transcriptional MerR regulator
MASPDLLETGIYTVNDAAELIGAPAQKIRAWIDGWPNTKTAPLLQNDLGWIDNRLAFSFANLMEIRFLAFFANAGVKIPEIRAIMDQVRTELRRPHPFATNIVFKTDGRKIVAEIAHRNGISDLLDLRSRNFEMGIIVFDTLKEGVVYDPKGDAKAWFPRRETAPNVIIHPKHSFGRPVLKDSGIPTEALAQAVQVEGSIAAAAALFEISERRVREAVSFENNIRMAA